MSNHSSVKPQDEAQLQTIPVINQMEKLDGLNQVDNSIC